MSSENKFSLLRKILKALGLSPEAIDNLVQRIVELLSDRDSRPPDKARFPYHLRDDFLSPAEHSFYLVLSKAVGDWAVICPKVSLGNLFFARDSDYGRYLTYTNKIDRKHVDFVLCHPQSVRPLVAIELDDKSHRREDRQERDRFVEGVFAAAKLPLVRIPVQQAYNVRELEALLRQQAGLSSTQPPQASERAPAQDSPTASPPDCPQCGSKMVLRTASKGASRGQRFWGCPNYPRCWGIRRCESG